ncbi:MAG: hypothetical protein HQ488_01400 [Parcubacteria group bacterium]|nr:hypothetical protein [Parcubacteria group bacterium]
MNEDKIIEKLIEHDQKLDQIGVVVDELKSFRNQQSTANDEMITILRRLDEERHFTAAWIQRVEEDLKQTKLEVGQIKERLAL